MLSRYQLLEHAWDYAYENRSNVVDVYVRYLREKIDRPFGRDSLETVRGVGYRLRTRPDEPAPDPPPAHARVRRWRWRSCSPRSARSSTSGSATRSTSSSTRASVAPRRSALVASAAASSAGARVQGDESFAQVLDPDGSLRPPRRGRRRTAPLARARASARSSSSTATRSGARRRARPAARRPVERRADARSSSERRSRIGTRRSTGCSPSSDRRPARALASRRCGYLLAGGRPPARRGDAPARRRDLDASEPGQRLPLPEASDEIRRLGETLNAMLARLEEGLARERRFVADASHELRTPLALLQTELELALRRPRTPRGARAGARSAAEEVDRLTRLAEDLLVLARADEGRLPLRRSPIPCRELLDSVARRFAARRRRAAARGRRRRRRADRRRPTPARAGARQPRRQRAPPRRGDRSASRPSAGTDDRAARQRRGRRLPAEFLPRAFDASPAQTRRAGAAPPGLGLAIVDAVARAHGGRRTPRARR